MTDLFWTALAYKKSSLWSYSYSITANGR